MKKMTLLYTALVATTLSAYASEKIQLEDFKKLKPLDSKSFTLKAAKKVGDHYMVTTDMAFRGQHRIIDLFVTGDKKMVIFGNAFNTSSGQEIKSEMRKEYEENIRKKYFEMQKPKPYTYDPVPLEKLAPVKLGSGKKHYYLFTDFDCPFCQMLEKRLGNLKEDVTLFILPYPLERLHPQSKMKALAFMEMDEKEKIKLLKEHKLSKIDASDFKPKKESIERLKQIKAEAEKAHLTGTPFLIDQTGQRVQKKDSSGRMIPDFERILGK